MSVVYELSSCGFEFRYSHLNFRFRVCFKQGVPWHSGSYKVWIHSETRTWQDKNIQSVKTWILQHHYLSQLKMYFSLVLFHRVFYFEYVFTYIALMQWGEKANFKQKTTARVHQKKIKYSPIKCVVWKHFKFWPIKNIFRKL